MATRKRYVVYVRHDNRKLHLGLRSKAAAADMTVSEFVVTVLRHFLDLSPEAQKRALRK